MSMPPEEPPPGWPTSPKPSQPPPGWSPNAPFPPDWDPRPLWQPPLPPAPNRKNPLSAIMVGITALAVIVIVIIVASSHSGSSSSNDVKLITPINPDCQTSVTLCKADADLIRNACDGGTTGIGLLLNSATDDATKSLYESELSALCPDKRVP